MEQWLQRTPPHEIGLANINSITINANSWLIMIIVYWNY